MTRSGPAVALLATLGLLACVVASGAAARTPPRGCFEGGLFGGEPQLVELPGSPEPALLAGFAVLRRPATAADEPPPLNSLAQELGFALGGYFRAQLRQVLSLPDGRRYFVVTGLRRAFPVPAARCLPPELRRRRAMLVQEQARIAREQVMCVVEAGSRPRASGPLPGCAGLRDIERGQNLLRASFSAAPAVELVPDGVATVRLSFRNGTVTSTGVNADNAYLFSLPSGLLRRAHRLLEAAYRHLAERHQSAAEKRRYLEQADRAVELPLPSRIEWLSAGGAVVRVTVPGHRRRPGLLITGSVPLPPPGAGGRVISG